MSLSDMIVSETVLQSTLEAVVGKNAFFSSHERPFEKKYAHKNIYDRNEL
jgi:hypothetical protein